MQVGLVLTFRSTWHHRTNMPLLQLRSSSSQMNEDYPMICALLFIRYFTSTLGVSDRIQ